MGDEFIEALEGAYDYGWNEGEAAGHRHGYQEGYDQAKAGLPNELEEED